MKINEKIKLLIAMVVAFQGINLSILASHASRVIGFIMAIIGCSYLFILLRRDKLEKQKWFGSLTTFFSKIPLLKSTEKLLIPIFGLIIILGDITFNILVNNNLSLRGHDWMMILFGISLLSYNYIPNKYERERDFAIWFLGILFLILIAPTILYKIIFKDFTYESNSEYIYYFLTKPLSGLLRLIGIKSHGEGISLTFWMQNGNREGLEIGLSCSGLYSVIVFISAFSAFILTEYHKVDKKVVAMLGLGILTAYFANLLRMLIIVIVGYYKGADAMLWTHDNVGYLIFMGWITLFWAIMFKYLTTDESNVSADESSQIN